MDVGDNVMVMGRSKQYAVADPDDLKSLRIAIVAERNSNPWPFRNLMKRCDMTILEPFSLATVLRVGPHGYEILTLTGARSIQGWVTADSVTDDPALLRMRKAHIPKPPLKGRKPETIEHDDQAEPELEMEPDPSPKPKPKPRRRGRKTAVQSFLDGIRSRA